MSFASPLFLCVFLPLILILFHTQRVADRRIWLLSIASCALYTCSGLADCIVMCASVMGNFVAARVLIASTVRRTGRRVLLAVVVAANVALLVAYKALASGGVERDGTFLSGPEIFIPLGLSFVTFQQIAFIVDCHHRRVTGFSARDYVLFITFFPRLVMGPIVQFHQFVPQLHEPAFLARSRENIVVGLSIFAFGLFKKLAVSDSIAPVVDQIFADAAAGRTLSATSAWAGAIGFMLQLFMDFSGYADMAIGLARMLNLKLPINFDNPYHAVNRFDLWKRWNITFVEFMRTHVFKPLARLRWLPLPAALAITGMLSGLWHGFGWTFVVWGLVQTALLLSSHYWTRWRRNGSGRVLPTWTPGRIAVTFLVSAMIGVLFRVGSLHDAQAIYAAMLGWTGGDTTLGRRAVLALTAGAVFTWIVPQAAQLFGRHWTAIDPRPAAERPRLVRSLPATFRLSAFWGAALGVCVVICLLSLGQARRFIYAQF